MVRSEEILLHGEECEEYLDGETFPRDAITSVVDYEGYVVPLE